MAKQRKAKQGDHGHTGGKRPAADPGHPGSERHADERRAGGPRYHGADWKRVDEEHVPGGAAEPGVEREDDDVAVEPGEVPGSRSARGEREPDQGEREPDRIEPGEAPGEHPRP